jgi:hypothetical protein
MPVLGMAELPDAYHSYLSLNIVLRTTEFSGQSQAFIALVLFYNH